MSSMELMPTPGQQLAIDFLQKNNELETAEHLAQYRMAVVRDADGKNVFEHPRYWSLPIARRISWLKDQILVLNYLRHVKDPNPIDVFIDAQSTDTAIINSPEFRNLTPAEIQDAFNHGVSGEYGDFYGITAASLTDFIRGYMKSDKWQRAKAIIYEKERKEDEEKEKRLHKALYEARLRGFKMPFWPTARGKKRPTPEQSEEHRKKIEKQRLDILKDADNNRNNH